jgi:ankyrin repeat protein
MEAKDSCGKMALPYAALNGHNRTVQLLVETLGVYN